MSARTWVGFDPALSAFGYAVMHRELGGQPTVLAMGTWATFIDKKAATMLEDRARRVREQMEQLDRLFRDCAAQGLAITEAYVESAAHVPGKQSWASIHASGRIRGIIECMCLTHSAQLAEVRPDIVKKAVVGDRSASKSQVASILKATYRLGAHQVEDLNATDALAVAHVGAHRYGHGVTVSSGVVRYRPDAETFADDLGF